MTQRVGLFRRFAKHPYFPIILAPILLFSPLLLTGKALVWGTPSTQFFPWWDFAYSSVLQGEFPIWNPLLGMGSPLAANYQIGLFYPPYWVNFLVFAAGGLQAMAWAATIVVCFHLILGGIGMACLLRYLKVGKLGQAIGGLTFSLSGYLIARAGFFSINAATAWLPWILLFTINLIAGAKKGFRNLVGVSALLLLSGHAQSAWYIFVLGAIWFLFWSLAKSQIINNIEDFFRMLVKYLAANLLAAGISAIQVLPTLEYLLNSQRSGEYGYQEAMTYSFWPWRFLTMLVPDLFGNPAAGNYWGYGNYWEDAVYIGVLPLFLALWLLIKAVVNKISSSQERKTEEQRQLIIFLGIISAASFLLALGKNTAVYPFLYRNIPSFDLFQAPTRWTIWAIGSMAILAGIGIDSLTAPKGKWLYSVRLAAAGCIAVSLGSGLAWYLIGDLEATFFTATAKAGLIGFCAVLLVLYLPEKRSEQAFQRWSILAVVFVMLDLISAGWGLNPGIKLDFYQIAHDKEVEGRLWMPAEVEYELKFNTFFLFESFEPKEDWNIMHDVYLPNIGMLHGIPMANNFDPIIPGKYQRWMEKLNSTDNNSNFLELMNVDQIILLENNLPVFHEVQLRDSSQLSIAGCAAVIRQEEQSLEMISNANGDYSQNLLIASKETIPCKRGTTGSAQIVESRNGYLKVEVILADDGWLFWSQTHYPGWKARIDEGKYNETQRANYLFQAVHVPAGAHQVEIVYRPDSYFTGAGISGVSLMIWVGVMVSQSRRLTDWKGQLADRS